MRFAITSGITAILCLGSVAQAQVNSVREPDRTVYKKTTHLDFGDVPINGTVEKPSDSYDFVPRRPKFGTHIKLRANFSPEIARSVNQL